MSEHLGVKVLGDYLEDNPDSRIVKLKLLIKIGKPTIHGRIYKWWGFRKSVKAFLNTPNPAFGLRNESKLGECSQIGRVLSYKRGVFTIEIFNNEHAVLWLAADDHTEYVLPASVGKMGESKVMEDYYIMYLSPATDEDVEAYRELGYKV